MSETHRVERTFVRKGKVLRVYRDGKYSYSLSTDDAFKLCNTIKDALRATGPVSTKVTKVFEAFES